MVPFTLGERTISSCANTARSVTVGSAMKSDVTGVTAASAPIVRAWSIEG
jgi:hypothetical protein